MTSSAQTILGIHNLFDDHYLAATKHKTQSLCYNSEGWGPLSPIRYDFTPCFLDVWILSVSVFGIAFGAVALWYLMRKSTPSPVNKNWHFWSKLVRQVYDKGSRYTNESYRASSFCLVRQLPSRQPFKLNTFRKYGSKTSDSGLILPFSCH